MRGLFEKSIEVNLRARFKLEGREGGDFKEFSDLGGKLSHANPQRPVFRSSNYSIIVSL